MAKSLSTQLLDAETEIPCPACGYPLWVLLAEVTAQASVLCPCCRRRVWLRDADGSTQIAADMVQRQIEQALKGMFG
jgi:uncharacterized Zn finger protein (UPF0148 family)